MALSDNSLGQENAQQSKQSAERCKILSLYCNILLCPGNAFFCDYVDPIFKGKWMHHRNSVGTSLSKGLYNAEALQKQPQANARLPQTWSASILIFP